MKAKSTVAGFFSYVRADDEFENRRISRLRERLKKAIRFHSGRKEFHIFQDWKDIGWGEPSERIIAKSIETRSYYFLLLPRHSSPAKPVVRKYCPSRDIRPSLAEMT